MRSNNRLFRVAFFLLFFKLKRVVLKKMALGSLAISKKSFRQLCSLNTLKNFDFNSSELSRIMRRRYDFCQPLRNIVYFSSISPRAILLSTLEWIEVVWSSLRKRNCKASRSFNFSEQQKLRESRNEYKWLSYVAIKSLGQSLD